MTGVALKSRVDWASVCHQVDSYTQNIDGVVRIELGGLVVLWGHEKNGLQLKWRLSGIGGHVTHLRMVALITWRAESHRRSLEPQVCHQVIAIGYE
eukprot:5932577-Amphidinium_carterae.1